ncbi:MmyB family transcriptional regulator [Streptomyces violaceusniger]|uniref:MmyB family transcriptional regulator n=1 Tax=Streptomyces violaceusniger TaxID=68280 RepID=UPI0001E4D890
MCSPLAGSQARATWAGVAPAARFIYLDPAARAFLPDWDKGADDVAAMLRGEAGRNPYDKDLTDLIGELSTRSEIFRNRWAVVIYTAVPHTPSADALRLLSTWAATQDQPAPDLHERLT